MSPLSVMKCGKRLAQAPPLGAALLPSPVCGSLLRGKQPELVPAPGHAQGAIAPLRQVGAGPGAGAADSRTMIAARKSPERGVGTRPRPGTTRAGGARSSDTNFQPEDPDHMAGGGERVTHRETGKEKVQGILRAQPAAHAGWLPPTTRAAAGHACQWVCAGQRGSARAASPTLPAQA